MENVKFDIERKGYSVTQVKRYIKLVYINYMKLTEKDRELHSELEETKSALEAAKRELEEQKEFHEKVLLLKRMELDTLKENLDQEKASAKQEKESLTEELGIFRGRVEEAERLSEASRSELNALQSEFEAAQNKKKEFTDRFGTLTGLLKEVMDEMQFLSDDYR